MKRMSRQEQRAIREEPYDSAAAEIFMHLASIAYWFGNKERSDFCARASSVFARRRDKAALFRKTAELQKRRQLDVENIAKQLGYTPQYLAAVLEGRRHGASPILIAKLARMGITTTVTGEAL